MTKKKTPTIYNIFEKLDDNKAYTKEALLNQDILGYYYKIIKTENKENSFRFWDLGMWLLSKNLEFSNYYKGSHLKHRDRFDNRKMRILNALNDLIGLRLIREVGTAKAKKVNTDVNIYVYTKGGELLAFIIKGLDPKQRQSTNSEIYDLAVKAFSANEDSSSITIAKFLRKCKENAVFDKLVEYIQYLIHSDLARKFKSIMDIFQCIFDFSFRGSEIRSDLVALWFDTIEQLEPEIKQLMIYRLKLSRENEFENIQQSLSREYERLRFDLRADYEKIALEGYCADCQRNQTVVLHYLELKRIAAEMRVDCPHCNTKGCLLIRDF